MSKLSLGGKLNSWVEPSFGDLFEGSGLKAHTSKSGACPKESKGVKTKPPSAHHSSSNLPRKRRAKAHVWESQTPPALTVAVQEDHNEPWVDTHAPQSQADLAVHKKKIEEVESWMKAKMEQKGGAILLLTGPSGCGKTATIQVLAKEQGWGVQEWSNPTGPSEFLPDQDTYRQTFDPSSKFNGFYSNSQSALFQEFLLRANKYNRLQISGENSSDRKFILVEDFPNQFYRKPSCLHDILRRFVRTGKCPLVFVVSDSLSGDSSSRLLFPKEVQEELSMCTISFNPVAPTSMMKVLSRIVALESSKSRGRISVPDKAVLEKLCAGSSGDIRSAINSLQFSSLTDRSLERVLRGLKKGKTASSGVRALSKAPRGKGRSSRSPGGQDEEQAIGGKDAALFLFRALGKILYCKRESCEGSQEPLLPAHLSEHQRDKLLVDPESVIERSHMSGEFFNLYLHQNYLDFFSNLDDVARASEYLSDADFLSTDWSFRSTMGQYGSSVATRGLLHSNTAKASVGFKPLHKPHWLLVNKKYRENSQAAQSLFISFCLTPLSLQTELLPYLAQLSNPMRNQAQIAFLQDVGRLPLTRFPGRLKLESLSDRDPGMLVLESEEEDSAVPAFDSAPGSLTGEEGSGSTSANTNMWSCAGGGDLPASQPQATSTQALLEEEDLLIEEYDSD